MKIRNRSDLFATIWTLFIMIAAGSQTLYAQQQQASGETSVTPKFGIKGGFNFANLYINNVKDENIKVGGNVGFYGKIPVFKGLSIEPELLYTSKGSKDTYNNFAQGSGEYRFNLNYVETPLLMVFNIVPNFSISAGMYAAFLTSANVKDVRSDGSIAGVSELNADDFHRFDTVW